MLQASSQRKKNTNTEEKKAVHLLCAIGEHLLSMLCWQCFPQHLEKQNVNQYFPINSNNSNDGPSEIWVSLWMEVVALSLFRKFQSVYPA